MMTQNPHGVVAGLCGFCLLIAAGCGKQDAAEAARKARQAAGKAAGEAAAKVKQKAEQAKQTSRKLQEKGEQIKEQAVQKVEELGQTAADTILIGKIRMALAGEESLRGVEIDIDCRDGVVTLSGTVPGRRQQSRAVRLTKAVKGVKRVKNRLEVAAEQP